MNISACSQTDCRGFVNQGVDSLTKYQLHPVKKQSTLIAALDLYNRALLCDSSLKAAWHNKIPVLVMLERHEEAIRTIDGFLKRGADSTILIGKGNELEKINKRDEALKVYSKVYSYSLRKYRAAPTNSTAIYFMLLSKSKVYGESSVQAEAKEFLEKYSGDDKLKALLSTLQK